MGEGGCCCSMAYLHLLTRAVQQGYSKKCGRPSGRLWEGVGVLIFAGLTPIPLSFTLPCQYYLALGLMSTPFDLAGDGGGTHFRNGNGSTRCHRALPWRCR